MRKISANYIFPVSSAPLKNGIIVLDDENRIIEVIDTQNNFREIAKLEFYGGVIVPAFVDAFSLLSYSKFSDQDFRSCLKDNFNQNLSSSLSEMSADLSSVQRGINHLEAFGTKAAADLFPHHESEAQKNRSKIAFSNMDKDLFYQLPNDENLSPKDIVLINRFTIEDAKEISSFKNYCVGTGSLGTHQKLSIFEELKLIQNKFPELSVWELIKWASLNPAKALELNNDFGSLEPGKKPGLNIISGIDFTNERLSHQSELKVLI